MPTIKLTDQFGLDVDAQPAPTSALLKYAQQIPSLRLDSLDLKKVGGLTLDQAAIQSLSTGLSFQDPIALGDGMPTLKIGAGAHGSIKIVSGGDVKTLPGSDPDPGGPTDVCYVAVELKATASADISGTAGSVAFGATPSTEVTIASYSRFPNSPGISLLDAVRQSVGGMILPLKSDDLAGLAPGQIAAVDVSGKLKLSGSADLFATANPLATVTLPAPLPAVSVSAGGSGKVGVAASFEMEYRVVARKLDSGVVRLGWYNKRAETLSVSAQVSEGISVNVGGSDVFAQVIGAISADPKADLAELAKGGVSDAQAAAIEAAVKGAISRRLELAVAAKASARESKSADFLYEIAPGALTADSRKAIDQALHGDLAGLHTANLPGVKIIRSIWDEAQQRGIELNVNLLGVLNYGSIAKLTLSGKVLFEPATGDLVIADKATAERIQTTTLNFGADTEKLRHVMAESFLITAAYQGTPTLAGDASLRCSHSFFVLQNKTSSREIVRDLRTGVAVGLLTLADIDLPPGVTDFGRTLFTLSTDYDSDLATRLFLDSADAPLAHELYEEVGRTALQFLVQPDDEDAIRLQPAIDNTLWSRMKEVGQPGFAALFTGISAPLLGAIVADYSTIQWWAGAMSSTARLLAEFRLWHARNAEAGPDDPEFQKLRQKLAEHLRDVASTTREEFGAPWGLIAMNQLIGQRAGARMLLTGPKLTIDKRRELAAASRS